MMKLTVAALCLVAGLASAEIIRTPLHSTYKAQMRPSEALKALAVRRGSIAVISHARPCSPMSPMT